MHLFIDCNTYVQICEIHGNMKNVIIEINFPIIDITNRTALQCQYSPVKSAKSPSLIFSVGYNGEMPTKCTLS